MEELDENINKLSDMMMEAAFVPEEVRRVVEAVVVGTTQRQKERDEQLTRIEKKLDDVLNSF